MWPFEKQPELITWPSDIKETDHEWIGLWARYFPKPKQLSPQYLDRLREMAREMSWGIMNSLAGQAIAARSNYLGQYGHRSGFLGTSRGWL